MEKIVIVVKGGMVQNIYGTPNLIQSDVEVIDLDTTDADEERFFLDQLQTVEQYLCKLQ